MIGVDVSCNATLLFIGNELILCFSVFTPFRKVTSYSMLQELIDLLTLTTLF